ncbi:MAG: hypothetical protein HRU20_25770 [Pseudomonadales bacterium]|nr:hypothetical protein [Pseudomonadales bacterium]
MYISKITLLILCILTLSACSSDNSNGSSDEPAGSNNTVDTIPNSFEFVPRDGVDINTLIESEAITVTGISGVIPIAISGGQYSINGREFTEVVGSVSNGDFLSVRVFSSDLYSTQTSTKITLGTQSYGFSVMTKAGDSTPDIFIFKEKHNLQTNAWVSSNLITVTGINTHASISIVNGEYSINNGIFSNSLKTINPGDTVVIRLTTSAEWLTTTEAVLTIGGVSSSFLATTSQSMNWSTPIPIESNEKSISYYRSFVDAHGDALIVMKVGERDPDLMIRRYNQLSGWGIMDTLDSSGKVSYISSISGDSLGNLLVVWVNDGKYIANTFNKKKNAWGTVIELAYYSAPDRFTISQPVIIDNRFYLLTSEKKGFNANHFLRSFHIDEGWSSAKEVYPGGSSDINTVTYISLYVDAQKQLHILWNDFLSPNTRLLYTKQAPAPENWQHAQLLSGTAISSREFIEDSQGVYIIFKNDKTNIAMHQPDKSISITRFSPYIDYRQVGDQLFFFAETDDGITKNIFSHQYSRQNGLSEAEVIRSLDNCIGEGMAREAIEVDAIGNIAIAWMSCKNDGIWANVYRKGKGWKIAQRLDVSAVLTGNPHIQMHVDNNNTFFAFWPTFTHTTKGVLANSRYTVGEQSWSAESVIDSSSTGLSYYYNAVNNSDGIHVLWNKKPHSTYGTYLQSHYNYLEGWTFNQVLAPSSGVDYPDSREAPGIIKLHSGRMLALMPWYTGTSMDLFASEYK